MSPLPGPAPVRVLLVASEMVPLVKTGGLADVVGALPAALAPHGVDARVLVPCYPAVARLGWPAVGRVSGLPGPFGPLTGTLRAGRVDGGMDGGAGGGADVVALDVPVLYDRGGGPYQASDGTEWPDNPFRFAALARAAQRIAQEDALPGWTPDVVHGHDWQAGLAPAYLALSGGRRVPAVTTIHNIAFQGVADVAHLARLQLPPSAFSIDGVEYRGGIGFLKAGLFYADRITTVSPTYAWEITTPEGGFGLDGLLAGRRDRLSGILNGIDDAVWNPARDPHAAAPFDAADPSGKAASTAALRSAFGLAADPAAPLFAIVSRLTDQKGIDLVIGALPRLLAEGGQLCVLGAGERALEDALEAAAAANPGRVAVESQASLPQGFMLFLAPAFSATGAWSTGDADFDAAFVTSTSDESLAASLLTAPVRAALLSLTLQDLRATASSLRFVTDIDPCSLDRAALDAAREVIAAFAGSTAPEAAQG